MADVHQGEKEPSTRWPGCTANGHANTDHVGDLDYFKGSPNWRYVGPRGDATCSCCDPRDGFPCRLDPATSPAEVDRA